MASVRLDFVPSTTPDMISLRIEESMLKDGPFTEIESVTAIGTYPNYISYYITENATDANYWFRIRWEGEGGIFAPYSQPLQGGTKTLVQEIVDRVILRNPTLNEAIVTQEAQAVVSEYMSTDDPNSVLVDEANYVEIRGMTNMTLARSLIVTFYATASTSSGFTAGLVSIKSGTASGGADPAKAIEALVKSANADLGVGESFVLLLSKVNENGYGYCGSNTALHGADLTRSVAMIDYGEVNA